ncbi:EscU/YscU/HrcU family type III secretion system export apparatus switch protein [Burkholderia ubonensis]|uniref:EscU/YscU/HrcU family type III secretion system export apparatus switch protein n=1 Tax=Burkholderia ubonensis TaxID=101571 RepID=UPI0007C63C1C|nr:EscU/YscU/HrcU family type III secretion system export apparatus switch protein [Burkholderia ubonensis]
MSEKTEQPTDHRLRQARRDGRISKSKDLTQALAGCVWPVILSATFMPAMLIATSMIGQLLDWIEDPTLSLAEQQHYWVGAAVRASLIVCVSGAVLGMVIGVVLELLQTKGLFSVKPIVPKFEKLNPASQIKAMFSLRTVVELVKGFSKVVVISAVALLILAHMRQDIVSSARLPLIDALKMMGFMLLLLSLGAQLLSVALAAVDVIYQKYEHQKGLRMSKDEVQREYKEQEGDPMIKGERRRLHHEMLS